MKWYYVLVLIGLAIMAGYSYKDNFEPKEETREIIQTKVEVCPAQLPPKIIERVVEVPVEKIVKVQTTKVVEVIKEVFVYPKVGCHADFKAGVFISVGSRTEGYNCIIDLTNETVHQQKLKLKEAGAIQYAKP